ncbi:DUF697 domain-containing protein [Roseomonas sp. M0104]|uniref:DUF697 domain-containing protein n=1 Tax=Teichococcus coralli TaxID=2545983 RepID=A0A845BCG0_9PROT|nr:DUF697 domain-containing protein [Pseudoroseomonas coralli]MXP64565.1 DUF697 domain-containing protein [Pseudoroseomonas coralli]
MSTDPGWADEPSRPTKTVDPSLGPALLEPEAGGLIRHGAPVDLAVPQARAKGAGWLASFGTFGAAAGLLVLGSFGLGLGLMLDDLFAASPVLGWLGAALGAGVGGLMLVALGREWRALRRLDALDALAEAVRETPDGARPPAALLRWAEGVARRLPEAAAAVAELHRAGSMAEARGLLATGLLPVLDARVKAMGRQAAAQVFLTAAVLPSPALDAGAMALIGLRLMRQVAVLHGVRPGAAVLWRLLRRLALSAGLTAGADLVAEAGVEQFVEGHAAKLAGGAAGAAVAARRMLRLAGATAECCRPTRALR